jgi:hypothetical protein
MMKFRRNTEPSLLDSAMKMEAAYNPNISLIACCLLGSKFRSPNCELNRRENVEHLCIFLFDRVCSHFCEIARECHSSLPLYSVALLSHSQVVSMRISHNCSKESLLLYLLSLPLSRPNLRLKLWGVTIYGYCDSISVILFHEVLKSSLRYFA